MAGIAVAAVCLGFVVGLIAEKRLAKSAGLIRGRSVRRLHEPDHSDRRYRQIDRRAPQFSEAGKPREARRPSHAREGQHAGEVEQEGGAEIQGAQPQYLFRDRMVEIDELGEEGGIEDKRGGIAEGNREPVKDRLGRAGRTRASPAMARARRG